MMITKLSRDLNGNEIVKVFFPGSRGFSIQTNGNLPITHRTGEANIEEIKAYVLHYGTLRQKHMVKNYA